MLSVNGLIIMFVIGYSVGYLINDIMTEYKQRKLDRVIYKDIKEFE
jgi:hypothetical protein